MAKTFTRDEVSKHNKEGDAWIIVDSVVYDVSKFAAMHPGGELLLLEYAGKDVTTEFYGFHRQEVLFKYGRLVIGNIVNEKQKILQNVPGTISKVPYGEPSHLQGFHSPYYNDSHLKYRTDLRKFFQELIQEYDLSRHEVDMKASIEVYKKLGQAGVIGGTLGPCKILPDQIGGLKAQNFDYFHELILHEEASRNFFGASAYEKSLIGGMVIGAPPVMHFGKPELQKRILPGVLSGDNKIVLAISEPFAGSDVANIKTTATLSADGKHYIVNGVKKWITGGPFADSFATAVRTGNSGNASDISMLLIERKHGVETKRISTSSGTDTAYVVFENCKVPAENLLGKEGMVGRSADARASKSLCIILTTNDGS
ncbi:hypothetical protein HDU91_001936 [Kappamyces sp. JEL0680]|nr:hypothetical protein HDU91_001936 [Kappamyces sp. JEL0680]